MTSERSNKGLHRFAAGLACGVVFLISAGALVKSLEAGLSVPDWPTSYGGLNPPRWWEIENVRAEHGHRLIAGAVALATFALAVWIGRREPRRWVRRLAYLAFVAVLAQAALGGITVLFFLPTPISVSHAALAQVFLCMIVTLALVTSRWWKSGATSRPGEPAGGLGLDATAAAGHRVVARRATLLAGLIFLQMLMGAVMRHTGAGLAIPDFPLVFGGLVPPEMSFAIGIHYAHRLGALAVLSAVAWVVVGIWKQGPAVRRLGVLASALVLLVLVQISLGGAVVLTGKAVGVNTFHVATGATLLAASVLTSLSSWRLGGVERSSRRRDAVGARTGVEGAVS